MDRARLEFSIRLDTLFHKVKPERKKYEVASAVGIQRVTLSHYTNGLRCPTVEMFMNIMNELGATDEEILYCLQAFKNHAV
jgi:transcriptional regulator with XRE-family HTH domain